MKNLLILFSLFIVCHNSSGQEDRDSLIRQLEWSLIKIDSFTSHKTNKIILIKDRLKSTSSLEDRYRLTKMLSKEYQAYRYDSALKYASRRISLALDIEDEQEIFEAKLDNIFVLRSGGLFKEALDSLKSIDISILNDSSRIGFLEESARTYLNLTDYIGDNFYSPIYRQNGIDSLKKALQFLNITQAQYSWITGSLAEADWAPEAIKDSYKYLLHNFRLTKHELARANNSIGQSYWSVGDEEIAELYFIKAAIYDIHSNTKETVALMNLSTLLFRKGETERAYNFIQQAAEDASFYGSKQRKLQVAQILPEIEAYRQAEIKYKNNQLLFITLVLLGVGIIIAFFLFTIYRQNKKLKTARKELANSNTKLVAANDELLESNKIKEEYIVYSFDKEAQHLKKLEMVSRSINRKLLDRKFDDIHSIIDSLQLKDKTANFYKDLDHVFLSIFPHFLESFNTFFEPEDQFLIKDSNQLPSEIRIFALMRLGIRDYEKIAGILNYSLRTIYNYKNKVKSKSILPNDEFDNAVMNIKALSIS
ncbi:hypothetical protein KZP23_07815 [Echinicola marina]|uniref:DUF6377 domain-containing protein n=1 Tax=Echinicola marina TaxID=2859768 RepID=UPI001CF68308|nr:DUF6377 domain-containing protein [Echinicola marina]UCS94908.1 hypothetical protein KZP23_07815 [Echinicola marina]